MDLKKLKFLKYFICPQTEYDRKFCGNLNKIIVPSGKNKNEFLQILGKNDDFKIFSGSDAICAFEIRYPPYSRHGDSLQINVKM